MGYIYIRMYNQIYLGWGVLHVFTVNPIFGDFNVEPDQKSAEVTHVAHTQFKR
jgi:hypothetical protein